MCRNQETKKNLRQRITAFLTCISFGLSFLLPYDSFLTIVKAQDEYIQNEEIIEDDGGGGLTLRHMASPLAYTESPNVNSNGMFTKPQATVIGDDFSDNLTGITITSNGETYTNSPIVIDAGQATSIGLNLALEYEYTKAQLDASGLLDGTPYVYYEIPDTIRLDNDFFNDMRVYDTSAEHVAFSGTSISGYYSIYHDPDTGKGLITIRFTDEYIRYLKSLNNGFSGKIDFDGKVDRADNADGDQNFTIAQGSVELDFKLQFDDDTLSISKSGTVGKTNKNASATDNSRYIDWTITINNPSGHINMTDYTLTDTMTGGSASVEWSNVSNVTVSPAENVTDNGDGTFLFTGSPETVTISYRENNVAYGTYKNKASVTDAENTEVCYTEPEVTINNSINVTKQGTPDYQLSGGKVNDQIQWTVTVENMAGDSLRSTVVSDSKISTQKGAVVYYYEDGERKTLSASAYTLADGKITFDSSTSAGIPSKVEIVYLADVTVPSGQNSVTDSNGVTVTSTKTPGTPTCPPEVTSSVTYKHQLSVVKKGAAFDSESGKIQWKVTILTTATGNDCDGNKESVNGYTITDPAFQYVDFTSNAVGFNAFYQDAWNENYRCKDSDNTYGINFIKSTDEKTITVNIPNSDTDTYTNENPDYPINKLELYYWVDIDKCTFEGYDSTADAIAAYNNGTEITAKNSATGTNSTGKVSGTGTGQKEAKIRIEASKSYTSDNSYETVIGTGDAAARTLDWKMTLTKDNGFGGGEVSVTDVLKSEHNADHYITTAQAGAIQLYGRTTKDGEGVLIQNTTDTAYYSVANTDGSDITANTTSFKITFNDAIKTLGNYHYIDIIYHTTAETGDVPNGQTDKFSNEYTFGGTTKTTDGLTFDRHNPNDVLPVKLTLNKNWKDNKNAFGNRPETIRVKVYQALADETGELPASPTWTAYPSEESPQVYELTAGTNTETDTFTLAENFPQWKVNTDGGITRYYYKVEEISQADFYTATYQTGSIYADSSEKAFEITNTSTQQYGKRAVDKDGNIITQIHTDDIPKVTLNETEYYLLRWDVILNFDKSDFTDTLPTTDSVFITGSEEGLSEYKPQAYYKFEQGNYWEWSQDILAVTVNNDGTITLKESWDTAFLRYYTAVPTASVSDGQIITNKFVKQGETTEYSASQKIIQDAAPIDTSALIRKEASNNAGAGLIKYGIEFNKNAQKLSNESKVDITDILNLNSSSSKGMDALGIKLYTINVYPYDENGNIDRDNKLPASDGDNGYGYLVNYKIEEALDVSVAKQNDNKTWLISGWQTGDIITAEIQNNVNSYGYVIQKNAFVKSIPADSNGNFEDWRATTFNFPDFDENGKSETTFTVPDNCNALAIIDWGQYNGASISAASVSGKKITPAELTVSVPDRQHLYIEYIYQITGYDEKTSTQNGDTIIFDNAASFTADNAEGSDTANGLQMNVEESHASSEAKTYPKIYKVDVSNYAVNQLDAEFKVAKYVDGHWVYASSITTIANDKTAYRLINFPASPYTGYLESEDSYPTSAATLAFAEEDVASTTDNESVHNFSLSEKTLYKFVEVKAPTGNYRQPTFSTGGTLSQNQDFIFYYNYMGYDGTVPQEAQSKVIQIQENETINIPNNQTIEIDAAKTFSGAAVPETWSAELELYWSNTKSGSDLYRITGNTDSTYDLSVSGTFSATATVNQTVSNAQWTSLPSGRNGSPIYYFVKEKSYTIGSDTFTYNETTGKYMNGSTEGAYTPVYTKNGANTNGTIIEVNNSQGIVVKKLWQNSNGKTIPAPDEAGENASGKMSVPFEVYGITGTTRTLYFSGTLTADSYQQILPTEHNGYKLSDFDNFEVTEKLTETQKSALGEKWQSSTTRKITNGIGTLEIINTKQVSSSTSASVQKIWSDGESAHTSGSVTAYLIQSKSEMTAAQLKQVESNSLTAEYYKDSFMENGDDILLVMNGKTKTVSDVKSVSITDTTIASGTVLNDTLTITGLKTGTTEITITKTDDSTEDYTISVINPEVTLSSGNWSAEWTNLPASRTVSGTETKYYYYAIEKSDTIPEGYTSSYQINGHQTVITNSKPAKISVTKVWSGISTADDISAYQKTVTAELQYKIGDSGTWTSYSPSRTVTLTSDSWTNSFENLLTADDNGNAYHYRVVETKVGDSTNLNAFEIAYSSEDITFEGASEKAVTITNMLRTVSLRLKKKWVDYDPDENDSVQVRISRSTDSTSVPVVTTIGSETTTSVTTAVTTTTTETTTTTTTKIIKIKIKNTGTTALGYFEGGLCASPVVPQSENPGNGWKLGKDEDNNPNPYWIQYKWEVNSLAAGAETIIEIPVVVDLNESTIEIQKWWSTDYQNTGDIPITTEIYNDENQSPAVESSNTFTFSYQGDSKTYSDYTPSQVTGLIVHVGHADYKYEYVTVDFGTLGSIKAGWYGNTGFQVEYSNLNSEISYSPALSTYAQDGNLTITFNSTIIPASFTITSSSGDAKDGYVIFNKTSPHPRRQIRPVTSILSQSTAETASSFSQSQDTVLSKMMGGRSGAVSRMMNLKSEKTFRTLSDTIVFFNANSDAEMTLVFNKTVTVTSTDEWGKTITNLPAYDLNGNPYYYWAEEVSPAGFDVSYQFDDNDSSTVYCINASHLGDGLITIQNKKQSSETTSLPEAGGRGTKGFTAAGLTLMVLSVTIPYIMRRKREMYKDA